VSVLDSIMKNKLLHELKKYIFFRFKIFLSIQIIFFKKFLVKRIIFAMYKNYILSEYFVKNKFHSDFCIQKNLLDVNGPP